MSALLHGMRAASGGLLVVVLAFSLVGSAGVVQAAGTTITPTTFADDFAVNGNCTLREAIRAANTDAEVDACPAGSGADTIVLQEGIYLLSIHGAWEDSGLTGDFDICSNITLLGKGQDKTFIDGGGSEARIDRVLDILPSGYLTLNDATVQHGFVQDFENLTSGGGGIHNRGGMHLLRVGITNNFFSMYPWGGGLHNEGTALLENVYTAYNSEDYMGVGAIFNQGQLTYHYGIIEENSGDQDLSVLLNDVDAIATFQDVVFQHASGRAGGHIQNLGELTIERSLMTDMAGDLNPVLDNQIGGVVHIRYTTIRGNHANMGMVISNEGEMWIENSLIEGNQGGVGNEMGTLTILNTTLANSGGFYGFMDILGGAVWLNGVTIAGNLEKSFSLSGGALNIANTILAGTHDLDQKIPDCLFEGGTFKSYGGNLVGDATGCGWVAGPGDQLGTTNSPIDPKLGPLGDYGGTTKTFSLLPGSPAIDLGSDSYCLPKDQRDVARPQDGDGDGKAICDIGAFEVEGSQSTLTPRLLIPSIMR